MTGGMRSELGVEGQLLTASCVETPALALRREITNSQKLGTEASLKIEA